MKQILVVGGAGYIGSYMCKYLFQNGYEILVFDNLISGHREAVKYGHLIKGDLADEKSLDNVFENYNIEVVMHFAAFAYVGESVKNPGKYYRNNVINTITLLDTMLKHNVKNFIFSSTCATFGEQNHTAISETHIQSPINPYGRSKLMVEKILQDYNNAYQLNYSILRYFNAAGADPDGELGEDHEPETHLIPLLMQTALGKIDVINVFGDDFKTRDGTCVRDYIHIADLAQAHFLSLEKMLSEQANQIYNLGNGTGHTVKEVIEVARKVTGRKIPANITARRAGDPAVLIGSSEKALKELGWKPKFNELTTIIDTAWKWHYNHPEGYDKKGA